MTERILLSAIRNEDGTITDPTGKVWRVVPMEPTKDILDAGDQANDYEFPRDSYYHVYHAMLAASRPQVEAVTVPGQQEYQDPAYYKENLRAEGWNAYYDALIDDATHSPTPADPMEGKHLLGEEYVQEQPGEFREGDGWIEWKGGECPVPGDTFIYWQNRSGDSYVCMAKDLCGWKWGTNDGPGGDIIAYRICNGNT